MAAPWSDSPGALHQARGEGEKEGERKGLWRDWVGVWGAKTAERVCGAAVLVCMKPVRCCEAICRLHDAEMMGRGTGESCDMGMD